MHIIHLDLLRDAFRLVLGTYSFMKRKDPWYSIFSRESFSEGVFSPRIAACWDHHPASCCCDSTIDGSLQGLAD